jgi:ribose 1,5-bisphosphokinase
MTAPGQGRLIAVVGPSGVGKDTLIAALAAARPGLHVVRRTVTRPAELGGEPFEAVGEAEFRQLAAAGAFCLAWQAHGLSYGLPRDTLAIVAGGRDAVANLSRAVLGEAAALFPGLAILSLVAAPETLAARLAARGREGVEDIRARLARPGDPLPPGVPVHQIGTDGPLAGSLAQALAALDGARG